MATERSWDFWQQALVGVRVDHPAAQVQLGRYVDQRRDGTRIGISIDPNEDGTLLVTNGKDDEKIALRTPAQEEAFAYDRFAWFSRRPVTHDEFVAWWNTGEWPASVIEREAAVDEKRRAERRAERQARKAPKQAPFSQAGDEPAAAASAEQHNVPAGQRIDVYAAVEPSIGSRAFLARLLTLGSKGNETSCINCWGSTPDEARTKAHRFIADQRAKIDAEERRKEQRAATRERDRLSRMAAHRNPSEQTEAA